MTYDRVKKSDNENHKISLKYSNWIKEKRKQIISCLILDHRLYKRDFLSIIGIDYMAFELNPANSLTEKN